MIRSEKLRFKELNLVRVKAHNTEEGKSNYGAYHNEISLIKMY